MNVLDGRLYTARATPARRESRVELSLPPGVLSIAFDP
jgi:hypothetical protein